MLAYVCSEAIDVNNVNDVRHFNNLQSGRNNFKCFSAEGISSEGLIKSSESPVYRYTDIDMDQMFTVLSRFSIVGLFNCLSGCLSVSLSICLSASL